MIIPQLKPGLVNAKFLQLEVNVSGEKLPVLAYAIRDERISQLGLFARTLGDLGISFSFRYDPSGSIILPEVEGIYSLAGMGRFDFDGKLFDAYGVGVTYNMSPSLAHLRDLAKKDPFFRNIRHQVRI